jgi:Chaperone of endosialidase
MSKQSVLSGTTLSTTNILASNVSCINFSCTTGSCYNIFSQTTNTSNLFCEVNVSVNGSLSATDATFINFINVGYSDIRLKHIIQESEGHNYLNKIVSLNVFKYVPHDWACDAYALNKEVRYGLSAQEVCELFPETVKPASFDSNYLSLDYQSLVPILVQCIKDLNTKIDRITS